METCEAMEEGIICGKPSTDTISFPVSIMGKDVVVSKNICKDHAPTPEEIDELGIVREQ